MSTKIIQRSVPETGDLPDHIHPVLARVYAARGVTCEDDLDYSLNRLLPCQAMKNIDAAVELLTAAIRYDRKILIVADFDADGATSCAVAIRCLRAMGAQQLDYLVPNRFEYGYGLTPEIVDVARERSPDLIITVDNGISSLAGVKHARESGIDVLVTDHHLPGPELPEATVIVNPNQPGDPYPGKSLAGVGVIFNIMIALRAHLRATGWFDEQVIGDVNLARVLDLVALGTVADVVPLEHNNRVMVAQGLARIRSRQCCPGILALLEVADRAADRITAADLGFVVGPRLNAAGRLTDMSLGIACLLADDPALAREMAGQLHELNAERRQIQQAMETSALDTLEEHLQLESTSLPAGICLYDESWHQGVVGILASRIKEKYHRPVFVFAPDKDGLIKGSGRSVTGVHIRDVLEAIATQHPELIKKFGGHAMAAGLTLQEAELPRFQELFAAEILEHVDECELNGTLVSDGELAGTQLNMALARAIRQGGPWGQGFPEPLFNGYFDVMERRVVGNHHLKLTLRPCGEDLCLPAIAFNTTDEDWPAGSERINAAYYLDVNEYNGRTSLQLRIEHLEISPIE